jgi:L-alanine-DL-glutamate epimerase-like enolase superfamily enzyme
MTAFTVAFDTPDKMAELAATIRTRPMLKLELGATAMSNGCGRCGKRLRRRALIVDTNESWTESQIGGYMPLLIDLRVALLEQPLLADADDALVRLERPIPLCSDESYRTHLDRLDGKYQAINIKLDKAGGLTEALALAEEAKRRGLRIMVGGVISTSLGIAPALPVAQEAEIVDLDGLPGKGQASSDDHADDKILAGEPL